jgi:Uma2 family endonuclease
MALSQYQYVSVEDYFLLDERDSEHRYDYIDGHVRMQAGGTPDHAQVGANCIGVLYGALEGKPCGIYSSDVRVRLSETRYVHPDVAVSCDRRDKGQEKTISFPCLVIEVLSPSTETCQRPHA